MECHQLKSKNDENILQINHLKFYENEFSKYHSMVLQKQGDFD